jgi:hypothetical protein
MESKLFEKADIIQLNLIILFSCLILIDTSNLIFQKHITKRLLKQFHHPSQYSFIFLLDLLKFITGYVALNVTEDKLVGQVLKKTIRHIPQKIEVKIGRGNKPFLVRT